MHRHRRHVKRLKKVLEVIAYGSLAIDIAISVVTLISLKVGQSSTAGILFLINYMLTAIVVLSLVLILSITVLTHYKKFLSVLSFFGYEE